MSKDYLFDTVNEIALQFVGIFQVFVFDSFLAFGAFVPSYFGAFVTADMEEFAGKQRNDFCSVVKTGLLDMNIRGMRSKRQVHVREVLLRG